MADSEVGSGRRHIGRFSLEISCLWTLTDVGGPASCWAGQR